MPVKPAKPLHSLTELEAGCQITLPAPKQWWPIIFMPLWLTLWTIGGILAMVALVKSFNPFLLVWLAGWLLGEIWVALSWLWMLTGKEIIEVSREAIVVRYQVLGFSWPQEYLAEHIRDLRTLPLATTPFGWNARRWHGWGYMEGVLAFDYGAKTLRMAGGIDEAEGKQILAEIRRRFPQYRAQGPQP